MGVEQSVINDTIGDVAVAEALKVKPDLQPEVQQFMREDIPKAREDMLHVDKYPDKDCFSLVSIFKNRSDNEYAGMIINFDKQGNLVEIGAQASGKAADIIRDIVENVPNHPETKDQIAQGYRFLVQGYETTCKQPQDKPQALVKAVDAVSAGGITTGTRSPGLGRSF